MHQTGKTDVLPRVYVPFVASWIRQHAHSGGALPWRFWTDAANRALVARAFPASRFHGYDISKFALDRAEANRREAGVENVSFHDAKGDPLPGDGRFGLITSFDCLHDMTDPASVMKQIRAALADDGIWLIADIKAKDGYVANVEKNPMAAMMYGTSVLTCMSSALSEPGGAGLGTLGLHEGLAREMTEQAGFTRFEPLDLGHPVNAFYVVRP